MNISVVVCVYDRETCVRPCLEAILAQSVAADELIVVDDGSTDHTPRELAPLAKRGVRILTNNGNQGLMFSRNRAVAAAGGDIIVFIDADAIADRFFLQQIAVPFSDSRVMVAGGRVVAPEKANYWQRAGQEGYFIAWQSGPVPMVCGCAMAARKDFLLKNKFCECFKYGADDLDLCQCAQRQGYGVYYRHEALVTHDHRRTFLGLVRQQYALGFANAHASIKNHEAAAFVNYAYWAMVLAAGFFLAHNCGVPGVWVAGIVLAGYLAAIFFPYGRRHGSWGFLSGIFWGVLVKDIAHSAGKLAYGVLWSLGGWAFPFAREGAQS